MSEHLNGSASGVVHPEAYYQERRTERQAFRLETETKTESLEQKLESLRDELRHARDLCCDHAGQIGLVYDAATDEVRKPGMPNELSEPPKRDVREPHVMPAFDAKAYGITPKPPKAPRGWWYQKFWVQAFDWLAWLAILPLGAFLGFSVGLMAGFPVDVRTGWAIAAGVFGIFLLAVMKVAVYEIALIGGRKSVEQAKATPVVISWLICAGLMVAEATLATRAILHYTATQSLSGKSDIPLVIAILAAICFSTPILLTSAFRGHREGTASDDVEARHEDALRAYHEKLNRAKAEHDQMTRAAESKADAEYQAKLAVWETERAKYEEHANSLDYRTLLKLRGRISVLRTQIGELEQELTNYKISRGHQESALAKK